MQFSKPNKVLGLDIGSHSVKAVLMSRSHGRHQVEKVGYGLVDYDQANIEPVLAQADAVREALMGVGLDKTLVVGALPGQTVVIRYPRLPDMPQNQIEDSIRADAGQNIPYDLSEVFLDWYLLDTETEGEGTVLKVLLAAAKHEVIEARVQIAENAGVAYSILGVDSLALADAAEACDFLRVGETVALINLGFTSTSIHFVKDGISNFIRDVSWGSRELAQAIMRANRCEHAQAEELLKSIADGEPPAAAQPDEVQAVPMDEDVIEAEPAAGDEFGGLLDPLDDGLGGDGLLEPLEDELGGLDAPAPKQRQISPAGPAIGKQGSLTDTLATPLSRLVGEIRRSFDYYEHQLFEKTVDRIILSGGIAGMPLVTRTLREELGAEHVEVADPSDSALLFSRDPSVNILKGHPAQFLVAIGLAARGVAEL